MNENSIQAIGAISLKVYIFAEPNKDDLGYSIYFKTFDHQVERELSLLNAWTVDKISLFDVRFSLGIWSTHNELKNGFCHLCVNAPNQRF